ncbi:5-formyltetrahydrofolate cyclo-ligase, mitochondrial-like [Chenopodium quinoa]|uniref:5-formyltetrahydrofolate cyclo-ligase, mitochondrial-like n=1 Tax=Chenopodium quinoa TaxID=63459 RepID=UPI000B799445|nr:5-formyltetrahydrofolate cyclo-ligase, mitochondrial-like [Chenopodium quinoa]XP_021761723.1 5-formyltetrahydrofolate cyclo-ligase, mitochondrial-like [Chenopodium quinoa]
MNTIGRLSKEKVNEVRKLMTLSFSLHHPCTSASPPSSTTHFRLLSPCSRAARPPSSSLSSLRMRSSAADGGKIGSSGDVSATELDPIFKQKRLIRSKVRKSLKEMDPSHRAMEDDAIQRLVLDAPWFKSSKRLCAYISCRALREVDTSKVLAKILQTSDKDEQKLEGKTLYVPRVEDKNSYMRMLNISSMDDLIANSMDILEPAPVDSGGNERENVMHASEGIDLVLLPGLAFDKSGRRLGRGGGYYDTFLRNYQQLANEKNWKQPLLVALSYSVQIMDDGVIPITPNDVFVDALVSPTGIIPISSAAIQRIKHDI